jgi:hypothetical protein
MIADEPIEPRIELAKGGMVRGVDGVEYEVVPSRLVFDHVALVDNPLPDPNCRVEEAYGTAKISFNQLGDIVAEWPTRTDVIPSGQVFLTLEQAYEGRSFGWKIIESVSPTLVKAERCIAAFPAFTIAKLDCQAGDTLVVKIAGLNSLADRCDQIQQFVEERIPRGVKLLLVDKDDTELSIIRKTGGDES